MDDLKNLQDVCSDRPPREVFYRSDYFDRAPRPPALPLCAACKDGFHDEPDTEDLKGDCVCPCHLNG